MADKVPILSIVFMAVAFAVSAALPIGLCIYFRKAKKADLLPFFVGCAVMVLFAFVLEASVHRVVLGSSAGKTIQENVWLYALYGGAMAGIFEETGRFIAFSTVLKKKLDKNANALMYGAGHGGIEAFAILGITSVNNIVYSVLINMGNTEAITGQLSGDMLAQVETAIQALISTQPILFLFGSVERIFAVVLHIALSVLVWFAVKNKARRALYPAAVLIHFAVDAVTVILSGLGAPTAVLEAVVAVFCAAAAVFAKKQWDRESENADIDAGAEAEV